MQKVKSHTSAHMEMIFFQNTVLLQSHPNKQQGHDSHGILCKTEFMQHFQLPGPYSTFSIKS